MTVTVALGEEAGKEPVGSGGRLRLAGRKEHRQVGRLERVAEE